MAPYWRSVAIPRARLRSRSSNTSSLAQPRIATAKAHAIPTAPMPIIPIFMILLALYSFDSLLESARPRLGRKYRRSCRSTIHTQGEKREITLRAAIFHALLFRTDGGNGDGTQANLACLVWQALGNPAVFRRHE